MDGVKLKLARYGNGIAKGMLVTIKHLFRHPVTTQYPEQKLNVSRRTRGNELIWQESTCIACGLCAQNCPQGVIHMQVENKKVATMELFCLIHYGFGYIDILLKKK